MRDLIDIVKKHEQLLIEAEQPDMSRRNFLRGAGKIAAAGAAVAAGLGAKDAEAKSKQKIDDNIASLGGAIMSLMFITNMLGRYQQYEPTFDKIKKFSEQIMHSFKQFNVLNHPNFEKTRDAVGTEFQTLQGKNQPDKIINILFSKFISPLVKELSSLTGIKSPI